MEDSLGSAVDTGHARHLHRYCLGVAGTGCRSSARSHSHNHHQLNIHPAHTDRMVLELDIRVLADTVVREEFVRKLVRVVAQHGHYMDAEVLDSSLDRRTFWQCCFDGVVTLQNAISIPQWYERTGNESRVYIG